MFGNILVRSIGWELFKVFAVTLSVVTAILVLVGIGAEAAQYGMTPAELLMTIPLIIPNLMPYAIPATTLYTACLVYGRMSHDQEIVAIESAGVHMFHVIWPAVLLGVGATAVTWGLYYHVIPASQYALRTRWLGAAEDLFYRMLQTRMYGELPGQGYKVWVHDVQGRQLIDPIFKRPGAQAGYDLVGHARNAELSIDPTNNQLLVHLHQGEIINFAQGTRAMFDDRVLPMPLPDLFSATGRERRLREMTIPQLCSHREAINGEIARWNAASQVDPTSPTSGDTESCECSTDPAVNANGDRLRSVLRGAEREWNMRPAVAFSCLGFVLVGCPIGIWFRRPDYLSAFVGCFLPTVGCYYPLLLFGMKLSERGSVHPFLALWAANAVLVGVALALLAKLVRR